TGHSADGGRSRGSGCGHVLSPGDAAELAYGAIRPRALPAGHALRDARNANATFGYTGLQRIDFEIRSYRGEAQTGGWPHQLGIQAAGAYGGSFSTRGASHRRTDGVKAGSHTRWATGGCLR